MSKYIKYATDEVTKKALGKAAKALREKIGLSVTEFANLDPKVTRQSIYNYENGDVSSYKVFIKYYELDDNIFEIAKNYM